MQPEAAPALTQRALCPGGGTSPVKPDTMYPPDTSCCQGLYFYFRAFSFVFSPNGSCLLLRWDSHLPWPLALIRSWAGVPRSPHRKQPASPPPGGILRIPAPASPKISFSGATSPEALPPRAGLCPPDCSHTTGRRAPGPRVQSPHWHFRLQSVGSLLTCRAHTVTMDPALESGRNRVWPPPWPRAHCETLRNTEHS